MATATVAKNGKTADTDVDIRSFVIPQIAQQECILEIKGITSLIMHHFSKKAQKQMRDSQQKVARSQKESRNPDEEWKAACYVVPGQEDAEDWKPGKYYWPATAFKLAFLYGVGQMQDKAKLPKNLATGWLFVHDDPILDFESVSLKEDTGRIGMGTTTLIYRPYFNEWSVDLHVDFNSNTISLEQVVSLMDLGGYAGGIGDWRPSAPKNKGGSFGRFRVTGVRTL